MGRNDEVYDFIANDRFSITARKVNSQLTQMDRKLSKLERSTGRYNRTAKKQVGVFGKMKGALGKLGLGAVGAAVGVRGAAGSVRMAGSAEQQRLRVLSNLRSQGERDEWAPIIDEAFKFAQNQGMSIVEAGAGMFSLTSAMGVNTKSISDFKQAVSAARGSFSDMETVIFASTQAMAAYPEAGLDLGTTMAKIMEAQVDGQTTVQDLSRALPIVLATAADANMTLDQVLAVLAQTTKRTKSTDISAANMRATLEAMAKPEDSAAGALRAAGLPFDDLSLQRVGGMAAFKRISELRETDQGIRLLGMGLRRTEARTFARTLNADQLKRMGMTEAAMRNPTALKLAMAAQDVSILTDIDKTSRKKEQLQESIGKDILVPAYKKGIENLDRAYRGVDKSGNRMDMMDRIGSAINDPFGLNPFSDNFIGNRSNKAEADITVRLKAEPGTSAEVDQRRTSVAQPGGVQVITE